MKILLECCNYQLIGGVSNHYTVDSLDVNNRTAKLITMDLDLAISYFTSLTRKKTSSAPTNKVKEKIKLNSVYHNCLQI
ncbi:MAG: hypothetical protein H6Q70_135 [Firmicutes bacterium]|nr:hypothetical protein [Ignavibacteriaceae bacterium]MBP2629507.1 hypothetical protein [Bacillota bacterium]